MLTNVMMWVMVYFSTNCGGIKLGTIWTVTAITELIDAIGIMALVMIGMFVIVVTIDCIKAGWSKDDITEEQLSGITLRVMDLVERI